MRPARLARLAGLGSLGTSIIPLGQRGAVGPDVVHEVRRAALVVDAARLGRSIGSGTLCRLALLSGVDGRIVSHGRALVVDAPRLGGGVGRRALGRFALLPGVDGRVVRDRGAVLVDAPSLSRGVRGGALGRLALLTRIKGGIILHRSADLLPVARLEAHGVCDVPHGPRDVADEVVNRVAEGAGLLLEELLGPRVVVLDAAGLGGGIGGGTLGRLALPARFEGGLVGYDGAGDALAVLCVADAAAGDEAAYSGLGGVLAG